MTSNTAKFAYIDTTSEGKLQTIERQTSLIKFYFKNKIFDGAGLCVPGNGDQLPRHITEHRKNGILEKNMFMIDWDYGTYSTLEHAKKYLDFQGQVVHGNLINMAETLWAFDKKISLIDFDDTTCMQDYHLNFLEKACKKNVEVFILVLTTRGGAGGRYDPCIIKWMNKLGIEKYQHPRGNMAIPYRKITEGAIRFIARKYGYTFNSIEYRGRGHHTMVSCLLMKS